MASRQESSHQSFQTGSGTGSLRRRKVGFQTASGGAPRPAGAAAPPISPALGAAPLHFGAARVYSRRGSEPRGPRAPGECDSAGQRSPAPQGRGVPGRPGGQGVRKAAGGWEGVGMEGLRDASGPSPDGLERLVIQAGPPFPAAPSTLTLTPTPSPGRAPRGRRAWAQPLLEARAWAGAAGRAALGPREAALPQRPFPPGTAGGGEAGAPALLEPCRGRRRPLARFVDVGSGQAPRPCSRHETPRKFI